MSWLRVDDRFSRHPKVTALSFKDRWAWIDVLCFCASYNTGGWLPTNIRESVPGATPKFLAECLELELLDQEADELRVHDWATYAPKDPTAAERQATWRRRKSNGSRNGDVTDSVTGDSSTSRARSPSRPDPLIHLRAVELQDEQPSDFISSEKKGVA